MKSSHIAMLVLASWYLMMPPWKPSLDINAPLTKWHPLDIVPPYTTCLICSAFRDQAACEKQGLEVLRKNRDRYADTLDHVHDPRSAPSGKTFKLMADHAICIEDDDARLRGSRYYKVDGAP